MRRAITAPRRGGSRTLGAGKKARHEPGRFYQWVAGHPLRTGALIFSFFMLLAPLTVLYVRVSEPARALMAVTAQSEVVTVEDVQNADLRLPFDGATLLTEAVAMGHASAGARPCLHGLFTPAQHSVLSLRRLGNGPLVVEVQPNRNGIAGEWTDARNSRTLRGGLLFRMDAADPVCTTRTATARMPIGGRVVLGEDFGPPARLDSPRPILPVRRYRHLWPRIAAFRGHARHSVAGLTLLWRFAQTTRREPLA